MKLFQKLRDLEAQATTEKTPGPLTHEDCKVILELLKGIPKLLHAIDVMQEALASISKNSCCELCQEAKLVSLSALDKAREIAGAE